MDCSCLRKTDFKCIVDSFSRGHGMSCSLLMLSFLDRGAEEPALWGPKVACKSSPLYCVAE